VLVCVQGRGVARDESRGMESENVRKGSSVPLESGDFILRGQSLSFFKASHN
jgi:hypothetical protein